MKMKISRQHLVERAHKADQHSFLSIRRKKRWRALEESLDCRSFFVWGGGSFSFTYDDSEATNSGVRSLWGIVGGSEKYFFFLFCRDSEKRDFMEDRDCLGMYRRVMRRFVQKDFGTFYF